MTRSPASAAPPTARQAPTLAPTAAPSPRHPGVGPLVSQVDMRLFEPRRTVTTAGTAIIQADRGEAWAGLLPAGRAPLAATFDEISGDWILLQSRLSYPNAAKSLLGRFRVRAK